MSKRVLLSKVPLKFSGTGATTRVNKEEFDHMLEGSKDQNLPNFCSAAPDGPNMWKCVGDCPYDEDQGMFPSCMPFDFENEYGYVYWCACSFAYEDH